MEGPLSADDRQPLSSELGEVLDRLAHECKTPLVSIKGYAELLLDQTRQPLEPDLRDWVRRIAAAANRLNDIFRKALAGARAEATWSYDPAPLHVHDWFRRVLEDARALATGRSLTWTSDAEEGLPPVAVDLDAGRDLLLELLENSARNTPDGGTIHLSAATEARGGQPGLRICVDDTGVGLPVGEAAERLFERFAVLGDLLGHHSGQFEFGAAGLGLGLAMVRGVARAHGGNAWAEGRGRDLQSLPGARVCLWLPAVAPEESAAPAAVSKGRLLVVDAHPEAGAILSNALGEAYEVEVASSGRDGLESWTKEGAGWDACVFDPSLPDLGGVEFVRHLRGASPRAVLVSYATASGPGFNEALRAAGADACLAKPVRARVLLQRLARLRTRTGGN